MSSGHVYRGWSSGAPQGPRQLLAGEDYSIWPAMKVQRARQLANELQSSIDLFRVRSPARIVGDVKAEGTVVEFKPDLLQAPVHEWSLRFGDIIHNYRASLDALVWALAHLDGANPKYPRRVQFPFAKTATEWNRAVKDSLASIPDEVLSRLRLVQPLTRGDTDQAIGILLHNLDVQDKHHEALQLEIHPDPTKGWGLQATFEDPIPEDVDPFGEIDWSPGVPAIHGQPFCVWEPVVRAQSGAITSLIFELSIDLGDEVISLDRILALVDLYVVGVFIAVEHGPQSHEYSEYSKHLFALGEDWIGPPPAEDA